MIASKPHHPQSQGKADRSHREFGKKLNYDMVHLNRSVLTGSKISQIT